MLDLTQPPDPLTGRERAIVWAVALFSAATRFLAMARSLWDWDEALFCLGMRSYDVTSHHPHPPGFPVYIGAAKLLRFFIPSDFRALQAINLIAGVLLFPAVFLLARELRLRFETGVIAAALCAFLPNVWLFGGTAFSDVPSIALVVFSIAMLFRGVRDRGAYLIGTFALALAIGIRPQNLLVGLFPGLLATRYRLRSSKGDVLVAAFIGIAVCAVAYGAAVHATGSYDRYMTTVRAHGEYISKIDSFRNPERPALWRIFDRFFLKQYQSPGLSVIASIFVIISAFGATRMRDRRIGYIVLAFAPFAISAWLMLDRFSINRFSIGYCPLFAILIADGIERVSIRRPFIEAIIGTALVTSFFIWTLPALTSVRNQIAPTVAAVQSIRQHLDPKRDQLFVALAMTPFVQYFEPSYPFLRVMDESAVPLSSDSRRPWLLMELDVTRDRGFVFSRDHGHLWNISRRHYFDVALAPMRNLPRFLAGWYTAEQNGTDEWRWMGRHSMTRLPPASGDSVLRLRFDIADEMMPDHPTVTILLNGAVVDRFRPPEPHLSREYHVTPAANGAANVLELNISRVLNPAKRHLGDDPRDLGLLVRMLSWGPG
jgi:4-amino-4-deoxy-L-arabinose transferase-like glycosyltransferase